MEYPDLANRGYWASNLPGPASRELPPASTQRGDPNENDRKDCRPLRDVGLDLRAAPPAHAEDRTFTIVAEQIGKSKFWLPSNIIVNQGDKVKLVLKNEIEGADVTHGFELDGYGIKEVVTRGVPRT